MRVLVCGDRNWEDEKYLRTTLDNIWTFEGILVIIEGEARGADKMAAQWARDRGVLLETYPADWNRYKKAAGPIRNQQMLDEGEPDMVVAFHKDIERSKGTKDMVDRANKKGVPVRVYTGEDCVRVSL